MIPPEIKRRVVNGGSHIISLRSLLVICVMMAAPAALLMDVEASDRPCRVWVKGYDHYTVTDNSGNPRNNPDDTLYPGDAFAYEFKYGFSKYCYYKRVHPVQSYGALLAHSTSPSGTAGILVDRANSCLGGYGGVGSWDFGDTKSSCGHLYMKVTAKERHCNEDRCYWITRSASDTIKVSIMAPVVEVGLYEHRIYDRDGYNATNPDMTNYVWDPVGIEHEAEFTFRDERSGTISFDYKRTHEPLVEEGGFECDYPCYRHLSEDSPTGIGFSPYPLRVGNGGGMYAYTATSLSALGEHNIRYDVSVINEGQTINSHHNSTDQLIVAYDPVYEYYDYSVLDDGSKYSYDNRQGIAMHYFGSMGSGPDDVNILHEERRSKINAFYPVTTMYTEFGHPPIEIDASLLDWNTTGHINGTDHSAWHSRAKGHAIFDNAGYGILRFVQEISDIIFAEDNAYKFYFNATTSNVIASDMWGGYRSYPNIEYVHQYIHAPLHMTYNATSYDINGEIDDTVLRLDASPIQLTHGRDDHMDGGREVRVRMDDYLYAKTFYDTGDEYFATGVVDESYDTHNVAQGSGHVSMNMNKTSLQFRPGYPLVDNMLDIPRYDAFALDSPMEVVVQGDGQLVRNAGIYDYAFSADHHFAMSGTGSLEITRPNNSTAVYFEVPEWFGEVSEMTVGDKQVVYQTVCNDGCSINVQGEQTITIINHWGSVLSGVSPPQDVIQPPDPESTIENSWEYLYLVFVVGAISALIVMAVKRILPEGMRA